MIAADVFPFTSTEVISITVAMGVLITSVTTGIVGIIVALRTKAAVDSVDAKADVITGHVNSAATAAAAKIDALQEEVKRLRDSLAERKETAALLAQAAAHTTPEPKP